MKKQKKDMYKIIANIIRILIVIITIFLIFKREYKNIGILILTMILTFYDMFIEKLLKIKLENNLKISIILFIFAAQCLGTALGFYGKFLWWDTMLHTLSGIIFFFVGETIIKQLNNTPEGSNINKKTIIAFGVCFSLATGVIWELFEFLVDSFLGQNMQVAKGFVGQDAIKDTMVDLISVTVGTIGIVIIQKIKEVIGGRNEKRKNV